MVAVVLAAQVVDVGGADGQRPSSRATRSIPSLALSCSRIPFTCSSK